jgi:hypothetical protein
VACQIVSSRVKTFLALEWLRPGEGEVTAALRLLSRSPDLYGSRFFDILLLDAIYAQAPVLKLGQDLRWDLLITLNQEDRDLFQDVSGLFAARPPDETFTQPEDHKTSKFASGTNPTCPLPKSILNRFASSTRKKRSPNLATAEARGSGKQPTTGGCGSPPWRPAPSRLGRSAAWAMRAGNWRTTAGMTSPRTGP